MCIGKHRWKRQIFKTPFKAQVNTQANRLLEGHSISFMSSYLFGLFWKTLCGVFGTPKVCVSSQFWGVVILFSSGMTAVACTRLTERRSNSIRKKWWSLYSGRKMVRGEVYVACKDNRLLNINNGKNCVRWMLKSVEKHRSTHPGMENAVSNRHSLDALE